MSIYILLFSKILILFLIYLAQYHIKNYFYVKTGCSLHPLAVANAFLNGRFAQHNSRSFCYLTITYRVLLLIVQCFVALFIMEFADTSSLSIIAFQLSGSRCEQTIVLFLCSLRFSSSSKRILISRSSMIVWSRKSTRIIISLVILLFKSYHAFQ